jgi:hypothetical protein
MLQKGNQIYLNASEAAKHAQVARATFYRNLLPQLTPYEVDGHKWKHYRQDEVEQRCGVHMLARKESA